MNAVHASNTMHLPKPGECARFWPQDHGQWLYCPDAVVPGEDFCSEHLVDAQREIHPLLKRRPERYHLTPKQIDLFWAKVKKQAGDGCWIWTAAVNRERGGYGCFSASGLHYRAHRLAYVLSVGVIPEGLVLDHLCRVPACVRPSHLEPVTTRENCIRGVGAEVTKARFAAQTHCKKGHPFSGENLTFIKRGTAHEQRACKTCINVYAARYREKKRREHPPKIATHDDRGRFVWSSPGDAA